MFGAGGGTSSFDEVEGTDLIFLWGSNARETHPIFFHFVLRALKRGAKLFVVDPRVTSTTKWAHGHLQVQIGSDIALANGMARAILAHGLENRRFIDRATTGFAAWEASLAAYTEERVERETGVPWPLIERAAIAYAKADRAMICWTLGITEHHDAVDNVLGLINLALVTGHVGREGSGLNPLRGQNNVQGGGDMGALPQKLPGFQDVVDAANRRRVEDVWHRPVPPWHGLYLTEMFDAMGRGELRAAYVLGENPATSEADAGHATELLEGLEHLVVQDIFLTQTAELAHVVFPASASFCEAEGTVTNSERRVQRVRRAKPPPGNARDDVEILCALARAMGDDLGFTSPAEAWEELRKVSPMHGGMSYARLEAANGIPWPCPTEDHPGTTTLHTRLWDDPVGGPLAPFFVVEHKGPFEQLTETFPLRLTTGRRLESFNTGVQSSGFVSPLHRGETIDLSPAEAARQGVLDGEIVKVSSPRGSVLAPVRVDPDLPDGLAFMTFHFPEEVETNLLTIDARDPKSGTAEFKAASIRIDKLAG